MKLMFPRYATNGFLGELSGEMNALVESFWGDASQVKPGLFSPPLDIVEADQEYRIYIDLPGVKLDDVSVDLEDDLLVVAGRRTYSEPSENGEHVRRFERPSGEFRRTVRLPKTVDREGITAGYDAGVMTLVLPKVRVAAVRKIEITTASPSMPASATGGSATSPESPEVSQD